MFVKTKLYYTVTTNSRFIISSNHRNARAQPNPIRLIKSPGQHDQKKINVRFSCISYCFNLIFSIQSLFWRFPLEKGNSDLLVFETFFFFLFCCWFRETNRNCFGMVQRILRTSSRLTEMQTKLKCQTREQINFLAQHTSNWHHHTSLNQNNRRFAENYFGFVN